MKYIINKEGEIFFNGQIKGQKLGLLYLVPVTIFLNFMLLAKTQGKGNLFLFLLTNCLIILFLIIKPWIPAKFIRASVKSVTITQDGTIILCCFNTLWRDTKEYIINREDIEIINYNTGKNKKILGKTNILELKNKDVKNSLYIFLDYFEDIAELKSMLNH
jgi:hypothetical protein